MPSISQTLAALARRPAVATGPSRLEPMLYPANKPGQRNPGQLLAWQYVPAGLGRAAPLVVVLHGCTQTAAGYDNGAGWSTLADRQGFALLFPEQQRSNNPNLCFNWFQPMDAARGAGEADSIHGMIKAMVETHQLDPVRVYVTGLSAGGAMAATLLACYPETFAAGAIVAGLPHGAASTVPQAFSAMRGTLPGDSVLQQNLTSAAPRPKKLPRVSIWQGLADKTVAPVNADALFTQWQGAHGVSAKPSLDEKHSPARHRQWQDAEGAVLIERWDVAGMGHGTPLGPKVTGIGQPTAFMLDVGLCSTSQIASFFEIAPAPAQQKEHKQPKPRVVSPAAPAAVVAAPTQPAAPPAAAQTALVAVPATTPAEVDLQLVAAPKAAPAPEADGPADPATQPAAYVNQVLEQHLPGKTGLAGSIKAMIADALRKAGLK